MIRSALIRILTVCDRVINAAWSRVNPTHEEVLGRIDEIANDHFEDGEEDGDAPTASVVTAPLGADLDASESRWWWATMTHEWARNGCKRFVLSDGSTVEMGFGEVPREARS